MISQKSIQDIKDAAKVEDIVGEFVNLKRAGVNMKGLCPFHNEKTPSFVVSPAKNLYKCFGCGESGDSLNFLMTLEQMSYPEALQYVAKRYGVEVEEIAVSDEARKERQLMDSLYIINDYAKQHFQDTLFKTDAGKDIGLDYFKERGFREETIRKFGLGFSLSKKDDLTLKAVHDGYQLELLKKLGLTSQYGRDFFRDRVIFSIHSVTGKTVGFAGRILRKDVKAPKYINSPDSEIYNKSKILYGMHFARTAIRKQDECLLVEGYTDVITLHQAGIEHVVATSGTSLTTDQIRLVKRYTPNMKFVFDGDKAGIKAALRGLDMVLAQDMNVKVVPLPDGEDPDSYLQAVGSTVFEEYLTKNAKDFIFFKTELLLEDAKGDPVKQAAIIKDIVASIALIPDPIKRSLYVRQCASMMELDESIIINETNKVVAKKVSDQRNKSKVPTQHLDDAGKAALQEDLQKSVSLPTPQEQTQALGDEFQEKGVIELLVKFGAELMDPDDEVTVGEYVLLNIQETLETFENAFYKKIIEISLAELHAGHNLTNDFYLQHENKKVKAFAMNAQMLPYEYSLNWEDRWDRPLQSQVMPEKNFFKDTLQVVDRLKLKKVKKMMRDIEQKIKEQAPTLSPEEQSHLIKIHIKLKSLDQELSKRLGTVIHA